MKNIAKASLTLLIVTNIVGILTYNVLGFDSSMYDLEMHYNKAPFISIIVALIMLLSSNRIILYMRKKKNISNLLFEAVINMSQTNLKVKAFYDSGNIMYDSLGKPIIVISSDIADNLNLKESNDLISVKTVSGIKIVKSYKIKELDIIKEDNKKHYDDVTAIKADKKFNDYKLLLHSEMM